MALEYMKFDSLDDLARYVIKVIKSCDLPGEKEYILADTFKTFAGEYHRLVEEGKIPKELQYERLSEDYVKEKIKSIMDGEYDERE